MYQVQKWGNSLGIRIPAALAKQIGLSEGTPIPSRSIRRQNRSS